MAEKIRKMTMNEEFIDCPVCDYKDGFHSAFKKQGDKTCWFFICPSCHSRFDLGFTL